MLTFRDRAAVGGLILALLILVAGTALRWQTPVGASAASDASASPVPAYREGMLGWPTSISPFSVHTPAERALTSLVFSSLVRLGPGERIVPDLAASWTVDPTGAVYTFTLRPDATWQDGVPVTADDVRFTIQAIQAPSYPGPEGASWHDVTVETLDARTVRFTLGQPLAGFLAAATQPIAPEHLLEGIAPADLPTAPFGQQPIGSGPYRVVSWNAEEAVLEATGIAGNGSVGDAGASPPEVDSLASPTPGAASRPLPGISRMEFRFFSASSDLMAAYRAGVLDAASGLDPSDAAALAAMPGSRLLEYPGSTLTALVLDLRPTHPELRDARTRRALLAAIDRDGLVSSVLAAQAVRADGLVPPEASVHAATPVVKHDPAAAVKGLKAAGWTRLKSGWAAPGSKTAYTLELLSVDEASNPVAWAMASAVARDWRAIGMKVDLTGLPPTTMVSSRLETGDFTAVLMDLAMGLDPDLYPLLASPQARPGGSNVSGLQDPALDTRLSAARRPADDATQQAAWNDLQTYLADRLYVLPIAWRRDVVVLRDTVQGPVPRRIGVGADRFYDVLAWSLADGR
jgi:peptide/nickel transport system substrate-binding protein